MTISIETSGYEAAHGRKPRGKGQWVFDVFYARGNPTMFWAKPNQTLTEAIKEAKAECGHYSRVERIVVLS